MTTAAPTFSQIRAQVAAIRQKIPNARVIGIRSPQRWTGQRQRQEGGETYFIEQCDSPLAMRIALREEGDDKTKVLITSLDDSDLGDDILVRLVRRRLFPIDSWQIIKSLFQAHAIDPRLTRHAWIAEYLMDLIPAEGYPPATGGFLDAEAVWPILLSRGMGLTAERPDLATLLKWSIEPECVQRFKGTSESFRQAASDWLVGLAGPTAAAVLDCVGLNDHADALPIGLAAGVVFHPKAASRLAKAEGKMEERYFGGKSPHQGTIGRWHAAATEVARLQLTDPKTKRQQLQRADEILREVGAEPLAYLSDTSSLGFDQRLAGLGKLLLETLKSGTLQALDALCEARQGLANHDQAAGERRRLERVDMALRLVRWLGHVGWISRSVRSVPAGRAWRSGKNTWDGSPGPSMLLQRDEPGDPSCGHHSGLDGPGDPSCGHHSGLDGPGDPSCGHHSDLDGPGDPSYGGNAPRTGLETRPTSLVEASQYQLAEGGFVDWARLALRSGDPVRELSEAYAALFEEVTTVRERQSRRFATLLRDATAAGSSDDNLLPVESILEKLVTPLVAHAPVLVIVIDGMSVAVFRELMADVVRHEWVALAEETSSANRPGLAVIPSITEVSRTSLLCGRLQQGSAGQERTGFAKHRSLVAQCRSTHPPILFHKASLQEMEDGSLAGDVRKAIGSSHRRVVGVVVNAVDDNLLKGEQIDTRWSRDEIRVLPALLHEAKMARRLVVLVSDHGHVLDHNTQCRPHEGGERWRFDEGEPAESELRVSGSRVVIPESKTLIAPWTEKVRYSVKKNGYHGGLTPQEMVVPIAVLCATDAYPSGWVESPVDTPPWWEELTAQPASQQEQLPKLRPIKPKPDGFLFDLEEEPQPQPVEQPVEIPAEERVPEWITALFATPVFEDQKQLAGRAVPNNEVVGRLLAAIDSRGGKITSAALARAIPYPLRRLRGLLAITQRVLNIDGYAVLSRDEASDTIELDRGLLYRQFDLA